MPHTQYPHSEERFGEAETRLEGRTVPLELALMVGF